MKIEIKIEFIVSISFCSCPLRGVHSFVRHRGKIRQGARSGCHLGAGPLVPPAKQETGDGYLFSGLVGENLKRRELEAVQQLGTGRVLHGSSGGRKIKLAAN